MSVLVIKRGTRAQIDIAAASNGLLAGELYLLTDELKVLCGVSTSSYIELANGDEVAAIPREWPISSIIDWPTAVSLTEIGYLDGLTSHIQPQINAIWSALQLITGGGGGTNLLPGRVVITDVNNSLSSSTITITELEKLAGATSNIQLQLDGKANIAHTHQTSDIAGLEGITNLGATLASIQEQLAALAIEVDTKAEINHTHIITEVTQLAATLADLQTQLNAKAATGHTHTISEISQLTESLNSFQSQITSLQASLAAKADVDHTQEISSINLLADTLDSLQSQLAAKADVDHQHEIADVNLLADTLSSKSDTGHRHSINDIDGMTVDTAAALFITDITPTSSGIVSNKDYANNTVPVNAVLETCITDTKNIRVSIACGGNSEKYSPSVTINGVVATLSETTTKRWFTGYADITIGDGLQTITAVSDAGGAGTAIVEVMGAGPDITTVTFGAYPGSQTELKAGDQITINITTNVSATHVDILSGGANASLVTLPVSNGTASGTITISSASGSQTVTLEAKNSFGTYGNNFTSAALILNQTYPTFGSFSVTYPSGKQALNTGDTGSFSCTVTNGNTVNYTSAQITIDSPSTYNTTKTFTNNYSGYSGTGTNVTITATRAANNATASTTGLVKIATIAPTAAITISPTGRLVSSPTGISYEVRITPTQTLSVAPTMNASQGTWSGSWTLSGTYWKRNLVITDDTARGTGTFSSLNMTGLSGITGTSITSGSTYIVGGFSSRTITFPAFSRVAPIGAAVLDQTKTTAQIVGGSTLTRYTDNAIHSNGYYIANADGTYNPTGSYLGLSDSVFAGSNTTGTLQATIQETA